MARNFVAGLTVLGTLTRLLAALLVTLSFGSTDAAAQFTWTGGWVIGTASVGQTGTGVYRCEIDMTPAGASVTVDAIASLDEELIGGSHCSLFRVASRPFTIGPGAWRVAISADMSGRFLMEDSDGSVFGSLHTRIYDAPAFITFADAYAGDTEGYVVVDRGVLDTGSDNVCLTPGMYSVNVEASAASFIFGAGLDNDGYESDFADSDFMQGGLVSVGSCVVLAPGVPALGRLGIIVLSVVLPLLGLFLTNQRRRS